MEGARPWWRPRLDGLAPRVAAYLSLALLPLGLIALYQTNEFQQETELRSELTLLALTDRGATGLERALKQAVGAGETLAAWRPSSATPRPAPRPSAASWARAAPTPSWASSRPRALSPAPPLRAA
jgi:hypothetical protein